VSITKFIAFLGVVSMMVALQILVMIFGWGLEAQSWWWIIGAGVFGTTFLRWLFEKVSKEISNDKAGTR
jgi:hypothetical protein